MDLNLIQSFVQNNPDLIQAMAGNPHFQGKVKSLLDKQKNLEHLDRGTLRLSDLTLKDGLEEIVTWGVRPLKWLVTLLDDACEQRGDPADLIFLRYEMGTWLEHLQDALYHLDTELRQDWQLKPGHNGDEGPASKEAPDTQPETE